MFCVDVISSYLRFTLQFFLLHLGKLQALEKYRYEQSLEHTSQFIEKLEKELEEYQEHLARYRKEKGQAIPISGDSS